VLKVRLKMITSIGSPSDRSASTIVKAPDGATGDAPDVASTNEAPQWSDSRAEFKTDEKCLIGGSFAEHEFLMPVDAGWSDDQRRIPTASIIVNPGTQPNQVVDSALAWIEKNTKLGPFFIIWYTSGNLVPETLRRYRVKKGNLHIFSAVQLFLFPGEVDYATQAVCGPDAEDFVRKLTRKFTYAFLSAYAFVMETGDVYFNSTREIELQHAVATRFAATKFLFVDSSKMKAEGDGERGYSVRELLDSSHTVTIYTVSVDPVHAQSVIDAFHKLAARVFNRAPDASGRTKRLCLRIVGPTGGLMNPTDTVEEGVLA
jgi:hypothetical protein